MRSTNREVCSRDNSHDSWDEYVYKSQYSFTDVLMREKREGRKQGERRSREGDSRDFIIKSQKTAFVGISVWVTRRVNYFIPWIRDFSITWVSVNPRRPRASLRMALSRVVLAPYRYQFTNPSRLDPSQRMLSKKMMESEPFTKMSIVRLFGIQF